MKTTKLIAALVAPAMFVACNDDAFESVAQSNEAKLIEGVTIATNISSGLDSRATFAGGEKGVFDNFYFTPEWSAGGTLVKTTNTSIAGDQVGICLPNPLANGTVMTNVPFYIAGYQTEADAEGKVKIYSLDADDDFYELAGAESTDAFDNLIAFNTAVSALTADANSDGKLDGVAKGAKHVGKGVFRPISGVMTGDYVLYSPYRASFDEKDQMGKIPAVTLNTIQSQTAETSAHVQGDYLFAYAKNPFTIDGSKDLAMNMSMTPAAYFFQFRIYTSANEDKALGTGKGIKLITVTTADKAKAFSTDGFVTAGTTNTFAADASKAVDLIGVELATPFETIPAATNENYKTTAKAAYLSTYPVTENLAGKNIVVSIYTADNKVATITKAAGSAIKSGSTDYWKLDLKDVEFKDAEVLVYNETTFDAAAANGGTIVLKNNITLSDGITINKNLTVKGDGYKVTIPADQTMAIGAADQTTALAANFECAVENKGTIVLNGNTEKLSTATFKTIDNEGAITVNKNTKLVATTINNKAVVTTAANITVNAKAPADAAKDVNGSLQVTTINNAAFVKGATVAQYKLAGEITVTGDVASTTIENAGTLEWTGTIPSTVTINNDCDFTMNAGTISGKVVNDSIMTIATDAAVDAVDATITNNKTVTNNGTFTLLGTTKFANNGLVDDLNIMSGLSRITNATGAEVIRLVDGVTNLKPALNETNITGVRIQFAIPYEVGEEVALNTTKTFYLASNLIFDVEESQTIGKIVFEGDYQLTGVITTNAIEVNGDATIMATSNITVNGDITIAEGCTLTGAANSYTICNDVKGKGSKSGAIYVK